MNIKESDEEFRRACTGITEGEKVEKLSGKRTEFWRYSGKHIMCTDEVNLSGKADRANKKHSFLFAFLEIEFSEILIIKPSFP